MTLPPFLLDQWIAQKHSANPPIEYDLASSTGPVWTVRELMALAGGAAGPAWRNWRLEGVQYLRWQHGYSGSNPRDQRGPPIFE